MTRKSHGQSLWALLLLAAGLSSCSLIDDNMDDCLKVNYEVQLKTNLTTQVQTVLTSRFETAVASLLQDSLRNIFREYAHDVDLSFYIGDNRRYHNTNIMDAGQATYALELPADNYRHLALANIAEERVVTSVDGQRATTSYLSQERGDTIRGHHTGLFTARKDMDIQANRDQTFNVTLYMVNCASILVVRTENVAYRDMQVYSTDFADGFFVNDSVFTHNDNPVIHDYRVTNPPVEREVYYAVTFPSCNTAAEAQATRAATVNPQTGGTAEDAIWRKFIYVTLPDGSITRTTVNVSEPLLAGQVMIFYAYLQPDGSIYSPNVDVTTSVQLNWNEGLIVGN